MEDLKTICNECVHAPMKYVEGYFSVRQYDYIVVESESRYIQEMESVYPTLYRMLKGGGQIACTAANPEILYRTMGIFYRLGAKLGKQTNYYYLCFIKPE
jgi:ubiquinone/menaquinone biosynthesis C-methylase UbiE